jgi:HSP20 family protein
MADAEIKYPVIDQRFNDDEQQIIIAATGASNDDFEIKLRDDILSIKRVNSGASDPTKYKYVKNDISRKKFDIAFKIPKKWDVENLLVDLDKGELIITIPVKEESKPKIKDFFIK